MGCDGGGEGAERGGDLRDRSVEVGGVGGGVQESREREGEGVEVCGEESADAGDMLFKGIVGGAGGQEGEGRSCELVGEFEGKEDYEF